jgi:hypothetical protein
VAIRPATEVQEKPHPEKGLIVTAPPPSNEPEPKRTGERDANWADWYAEYMVAEQAGKELPQ